MVQPTVSIADASVTEGGTLAFRVSLSAATNQEVTVYVTINNGTADYDDYVSWQGFVRIAAGSTSTYLNVDTNSDNDV